MSVYEPKWAKGFHDWTERKWSESEKENFAVMAEREKLELRKLTAETELAEFNLERSKQVICTNCRGKGLLDEGYRDDRQRILYQYCACCNGTGYRTREAKS